MCFLVFIECQTAVHKKCHDKMLGTCSESSFNSESTIVRYILFYIQVFVSYLKVQLNYSPKYGYKFFFMSPQTICSTFASGSRSTCRIAFGRTTLCRPPSAITAARCCMAFFDRASVARVSDLIVYIRDNNLCIYQIEYRNRNIFIEDVVNQIWDQHYLCTWIVIIQKTISEF